MVVIPKGTFVSGCLQMGSKTVLHLCDGAMLKMKAFDTFPKDDNGYRMMEAPFITGKKEASDIVKKAKAEGRRIISVGTTSTRTLESVASIDPEMNPHSGYTNIFIYPGYEFKCIDSLITNFHLPESTLIMLVSALAGRENVLNAYKHAVEEEYRFFSFGDAMFITDLED